MSEFDVRARGVTKSFGGRRAVDDITLDIRRGEFFSLLGPSGCGKTTLMRMIAGFEFPDSGTIELGGQDMAGVPPHKRDVNMVFQSYALFPHLTVEKNVAFGLERKKVGKAEALAYLQRRWGLAAHETLAVGDNWNDREMLERAGLGLVMGNADPALRALGLPVLPSNDEDGVAVALETYVLDRREP